MSWLSSITGEDARKKGSQYTEQAAVGLEEQRKYLQSLYNDALPRSQRYADFAENPYGNYDATVGSQSQVYQNAYSYDPYNEQLNQLREGENAYTQNINLERTLSAIGSGGAQTSVQGNQALQARLADMVQRGQFANALQVQGGEARSQRYLQQLASDQQNYFNRVNGQLQAGAYTTQQPLNVAGMMAGSIGGLQNAGAAMTQQGNAQLQGLIGLGTAVAGATTGNPAAAMGASRGRGEGANRMGTNQTFANPMQSNTANDPTNLGGGVSAGTGYLSQFFNNARKQGYGI